MCMAKNESISYKCVIAKHPSSRLTTDLQMTLLVHNPNLANPLSSSSKVIIQLTPLADQIKFIGMLTKTPAVIALAACCKMLIYNSNSSQCIEYSYEEGGVRS